MKKLLSTTLAVSILSSMSFMPAFALVEDNVLPHLPTGVTNEKVTTNGTNMNIVVGSGQKYDVDTIIWKDYNIGANGKVNYEFTNHHQTSINKVDAAGGLSQIYGKIRNSSCAGCGYEKTGKIFLLNPNGVLFGENADVNLNSFTVSTFDANYDETTKTLNLDRGGKTSDFGITVYNTAEIRGDKGVNFVSDNVVLYKGSLISTNTGVNSSLLDAEGNTVGTAVGKVKIITADGINFVFYENGGVKEINNTIVSDKKMTINVNGEITTGEIDIRNHSTNTESEINVNEGILKATKAEIGNNGNIWLTANNKVVLDGANFTTDGENSNIGGNVVITAGQKISIGGTDANIYGEEFNGSTTIKAIGNIELTATNEIDGEILIDGSILEADGNVNLKANGLIGKILIDGSTLKAKENLNFKADSLQEIKNNSNLEGKNITFEAASLIVPISTVNTVKIDNSSVTATENLNIYNVSDDVELINANVKANGNFTVVASGNITVKDSSNVEANNINFGPIVGSTNPPTKIHPYSTNILNSSLKANDKITMSGKAVTFNKANIEAGNEFNANALINGSDESGAGSIVFNGTTSINAPKINLNAEDTIFHFPSMENQFIQTEEGILDAKGNKVTLNAGNSIDIHLMNIGNKDKGLIAETNGDLNIEADGDLSVSRLVSKNGDLTLKADKVFAGKEYTTEQKLNDDLVNDRSYIEVRNGTFTSITANDKYVVTASGERTADGANNMRHHIEYGNGAEKILLVTKMPYLEEGQEVNPDQPNINDDQASMLNRLPQQPQTINNVNNITDGRTSFIDVFAAASQIEIDDDEE